MAENYDIPAPKKHMLSMQIDPALFEKATDEEKKQADVMAESNRKAIYGKDQYKAVSTYHGNR